MPKIEIETHATLEDVDRLVEHIESGTERVYIATAGLTTVGAIEILEAKVVDDE